jgi:subtilisin family serine protease
MIRLAAIAALALAVGAAAPSRAAAPQPGPMLDVLVVLKKQADLSSAQHGNRAARLNALVTALRTTAASEQTPVLDALNVLGGRVSKVSPLWIINAVEVVATQDVVDRIAALPQVQEIRPNATVQAPTETATAAAPEPNVALVNAPALWDRGYTGQGVVVANMDTGVDATHPDLSARWRGGTNSWFDPNGEHPSTPTDISGHGTWTMGVIVGGDAGGSSIGVAPGAKWIAVKIFNDRGTATTANIHRGFQWLLDPDGNPSTPDAPNVVNNSWTLSSPGCNLEFQPDLRSLRAAGIVPVFAAGNYGPATGSGRSPANNPEALAVGGTDLSDTVDPGSSRGPSACGQPVYPQLVAPGVNVMTSDLYASYTSQTGTSLAAPHVAGALALLLSAFPNLPADRQQSALEGSAVELGAAGPDADYGHGRLDALAAYAQLSEPDFSVSGAPSSAATAPGGNVSYTVTIGALNGFDGDVSLSLSGLSAAQASWTFSPGTVTGAGSSQLTVTTAPSLAAGSYPLTITGTSGTTTHSTSVTLVVDAPPDFTLSGAPASASTVLGGSVSYTATVTSLNGFTGDVALSLSGLSAAQASWSFTPASIAAAGSSQLTIATSPTLAPGSYPLTVTGTSGSLSHSAPVELVVDAPQGPVAAYGFEEGSGASVLDASGKSNTGTLQNATRTTGGRFGSALSFNGTNARVNVPDASSLDLTNAMTLEAWLRPSALWGWRTALLKEQPGNFVYALYANSNTNRPSGHVNVGTDQNTRGTAQLALNTWTHLAATYDGTTLRLYVNGTLASSRPVNGAMPNSSGALRIGGNAVWGEYFSGRIDEVRVYNRALTAGELQTDMTSPVVPPDTSPPSAPSNLSATALVGAVSLSWGQSTDNVGVSRYDLHRGTSAGFTVSDANRIAQPTGTTYTDSGLASGTYYYRVTAVDAAGNVGPPSNEANAAIVADTSGLVAAYGFAEAGGTTVVDSSGKGNAGTLQNAVRTSNGKYGSALSFNGSNARVNVPDASSLDLTSGMTLEAWVKPATLSGWRTALLKEQPGQLVYALYANTDTNRPSAHVFNGADLNTRGTAQLPLNTWTHLAATYDGSALRLYVNGTLASSRGVSGSMPNSTGALRIGGNAVWGEYFNGVIDEVRIYNRALTASQIQADLVRPV